MNITILCVGSIKESFFRDAVAEYSKRLSKYIKLDIIEVKDEKTKEKLFLSEEERVKDIEGMKLLSKLKDNTYAIALDISGKKLDSIELSNFISDAEINGKGNIVFIIGGSLGLSRKVLDRVQYRLSFSDMTFPHQLMRIILLEQIYRSYRIKNNEPYHK